MSEEIPPKWLSQSIHVDYLENSGKTRDLACNDHYTSQPLFQDGWLYKDIKNLIDTCEKNGIEFDIFSIPSALGKIMLVWHQRGEPNPRYKMFEHNEYHQ